MLLHILEWFWLFAPFACHFWNIFKGAPSSSGACDLVSRPVPQAKGIRSRKTTRPKLKGIDGYSKPMRVVSSESTFTILSFTRGQATLVRHPTYKSRRSAPKPFTAFRGAEGWHTVTTAWWPTCWKSAMNFKTYKNFMALNQNFKFPQDWLDLRGTCHVWNMKFLWG